MKGDGAVEAAIDDMLAQTSRALARGRKGVAGALADQVAVEICGCHEQPVFKAMAQRQIRTAVLLVAGDQERPTLTQVQECLRHIKDTYKPGDALGPQLAVRLAEECLALAISFGGSIPAKRAFLSRQVAEAKVGLAAASQALDDFGQIHGL